MSMIKRDLEQNMTGEDAEQEQKEDKVLQEEEEYKPQHPMLEFKQTAEESKADHLDDYVEVQPFESKEQ